MKKEQPQSLLPPLWIITVAFLWLLFFLVSELQELVVFLVIGYSIAYILDPVLDWLQRKKISRSLGLIFIILLMVIVGVVIAVTAIPVLLDEFKHFLDIAGPYLSSFQGKILELRTYMQQRFPSITMSSVEAGGGVEGMIPKIDGATIKGILAGFFGVLFQGYSFTMTLVNLTLLPFIVYYLALDLDDFHKWVARAIPRSHRKEFRSIALEIDQYVSAFVRGQISVCIILFLLYTLGFWILGLKLWFLLGVISGLGNIVPYLGFACGIVLSSIMALATYGDWTHLFLTWGIFAIVQFLEGFVITPKVVGDKVGLSPLIVILSLVAGGKLFGLLGIFLAIPGAAVLRVLLSHGHRALVKKMEDS